MSIQLPPASNFQPWYTQRRPLSSLRPKNSEAPRCGQLLATSPTLPLLSLKPINCSPRSSTRTGSESGCGNSDESIAGTQYSRIRLPIGVPGPTRVISTLSSFLSMQPTPLDDYVYQSTTTGKCARCAARHRLALGRHAQGPGTTPQVSHRRG